jgi:hypothetical protein
MDAICYSCGSTSIASLKINSTASIYLKTNLFLPSHIKNLAIDRQDGKNREMKFL